MKALGGNIRDLAYGTGAGMLILGAIAVIFSQPARATVKFATDTGKACGDCHVSSSGGGKLTAFGEKFKANGNKLP